LNLIHDEMGIPFMGSWPNSPDCERFKFGGGGGILN